MVGRRERKYRIETMDVDAVRTVLAGHPASFRTAFPDRIVNSIYFDNANLECYLDNLHGVRERAKFRVRWYGDHGNQVPNPVLEIKCKDGDLGWKHIHPLGDFEFGLGWAAKLQGQLKALARDPKLLRDTPLLRELLNLRPVVVVDYHRSYLLSLDQQYRATVDWQLQFRSVDGRSLPGRPRQDHAVVLEVKYDAALDDDYDRIGQHLPFRLGKNSKYVAGMLLVGRI